ncbi:hypothetical protein AB6A40_007411 [Gnathostoma spinigerum]|uniref:F-ATPase delta subunit n=1 Tax=Gnathostoma spinigerum TaxID=75299 RepID=A0ABD6EVJ8_9BILA
MNGVFCGIMNSRMVRVFPNVFRRVTKSYATASPTQTSSKSHSVEASEELKLIFATPRRAIFDEAVVKQVDVPTVAGYVGILAKHVPILGVLRPGLVQVHKTDGEVVKMFVSSGTLSMNIDGTCQVLAEEATEPEHLDETLARQHLESAQRRVQEGGSDIEKAEAYIAIEVCEAILKAIHGQV